MILEQIPPLPVTAARLLAVIADPDVEINRLAGIIEQDPPLTARLLGIANSAYYGWRRPVVSVKAAIIYVLGVTLVRNIALAAALTGGFSTAACPRFNLTLYWTMALGTADLAASLARASNRPDAPDPDMTHLAGLLHNLGELLLVHFWPAEMNEALRRLEQETETRLIDHERVLLGTDHWSAGALLARQWQLPPMIAEAIEHFDEPNYDNAMLRIVRSAKRWLAGVIEGHPEPLRASDVEDTYCEYRAETFLEKYGELEALAKALC